MWRNRAVRRWPGTRETRIRIAAALVAGIAFGCVAGYATVTDIRTVMRPVAARPLPPPREDVYDFAPDLSARPAPTSADFDEVAADCEICSDYQIGYHRAERDDARTTSDCEAYPWSYERGCLAYVRRNAASGG